MCAHTLRFEGLKRNKGSGQRKLRQAQHAGGPTCGAGIHRMLYAHPLLVQELSSKCEIMVEERHLAGAQQLVSPHVGRLLHAARRQPVAARVDAHPVDGALAQHHCAGKALWSDVLADAKPHFHQPAAARVAAHPIHGALAQHHCAEKALWSDVYLLM